MVNSVISPSLGAAERDACLAPDSAEPARLSTWGARKPAWIRAITCPFQGLRLREIGICEGHVVEVLRTGDPLICRVGTSRMGICRRLAEHVLLAAAPDPAPPAHRGEDAALRRA